MTEISTHEVTTMSYQRPEIEKGYANQYLAVDLSTPTFAIEPVSAEMKKTFIGGKGFDLWLLWHAVKDTTKWNDPENAICIASGPLGGTPSYPGAGKSIVTAISPLTEAVMDSNVGGYFGPYLKFTGFDALQVQGKSENEIIIFIDGINQQISIYNSEGLPDDAYALSRILTDHFSQGKPRSISVVSTGSGAMHSRFGCLNVTWYDPKRKRPRLKQAGRGGLGTVFTDKGIKAIVVRWDTVSLASNNPSDKDGVRSVAKQYSKEIVAMDPKQNQMAKIGTTHIVPIMNDFDLLPTHNFQFGRHKGASLIGRDAFADIFDPGFDGCWIGCAVACSPGVKDYCPLTGPYKGQAVFWDGLEYEAIAGCGSNLGIFDPYTIIEMNFYCDAYGLDAIAVGTAIAFAMECFERGIIDETHGSAGQPASGPAADSGKFEAYSVEVDIIEKLKRIYYHAKRMAKTVVEIEDEKAVMEAA